ncbi:ArsR/SmtB family transcription factor [Labrys monachus]|uniref:Ubiquinone/menaquinone biosynthesis C-methylase UbiE/DNA-binding HxlR family transcriptional regulator n=1 Tax=Labrys monachus TaxID=217067 RepID=A0ABU0FKY4_9HYPH|nr:metalloregulator ArsR/SmtB family transcription factor [Labrys monachus]MDQ0395273.1 ubiquinone/menaquinone biosynthesis C-methylase UbiE/DNA-binding HxlR family transcriptional regulator [Labrys monachus]
MATLAPFDTVLTALKAAGEPTRLRLLAILAEGELNVTDLTEILGQSQPRISRHLKLLVEAGLVERIREGAWAFFKLAETTQKSEIFMQILTGLDRSDRVLARDRSRLVEVRRSRAAIAADYFRAHAEDWDRIRALHASDEAVEAALRDEIGTRPVQALLDIGTGTGRMLELFAPLAVRAVGVDASAEMLAVARANLERSGVRNAVVRQGDLFALPVEAGAYDLVIIHQVLHYLDDGARALREVARALRPGGRLVIVDFAPHELEFLREDFAHRRLGFARETIEHWFEAAHLEPAGWRMVEAAEKPSGIPARLTVSIWTGRDPRRVSDRISIGREVA